MQKSPIKIQKPGEKILKEHQLAWRIAVMATENWSLTNDITEMVGNRMKIGRAHV